MIYHDPCCAKYHTLETSSLCCLNTVDMGHKITYRIFSICQMALLSFKLVLYYAENLRETRNKKYGQTTKHGMVRPRTVDVS